MQLIDKFTQVTETTYLLADSWCTSEKLMLHAVKRGYHFFGRIKSIEVIYHGGIKTNVKEFSTLSVRAKQAQLQQVIILTMLTCMGIKSLTLKMLLFCFAGANPFYPINQHSYIVWMLILPLQRLLC